MHPDLIRLKKYGFETAPDKGMQIALAQPRGTMNGNEIIKSPHVVPNHRIHAVWNGDRVKIHFDKSRDSKTHTSSNNHSQAERIKAFMRYVDGKEPYRTSFKKLIANLPVSTEITPYTTTTSEKLSTKSTSRWWQSAIQLLYTIIKNIWNKTV